MTTLLDKVFGTYIGVEFKDDSIVVTYLKNSFAGITLLSSSTFPLRYGEAVPNEVRDYVKRHGSDVSKVFVTIPDNWAIMKFIDIPSMKGKGKGALANLMKFEIERHIPFEIDEVAYDFIIMDGENDDSSVAFVTVQKEKIDFVKGCLEKLSLQSHAITITSFAVLNSIELSEVSVGGWQDIIGIVRKSDVLGKKDETNVAVYFDKKNVSIAVMKDGLCSKLRSMPIEESKGMDEVIGEIAHYISEVQSLLSVEQFNKLLIAGDTTPYSDLKEELSRKIKVGAITVNQVEKYSGTFKGLAMNGLAPSIGACFGGLGIGTYRINLLPHKMDYEISRIAPLASKVFMVLIFILLVAIFATEAVKEKKYLEKMELSIAKNKPEVKELENVILEMKSLRKESKLLDVVKKNEVTLEILAELAVIMPRDSWVTNLHYKSFDMSDARKNSGELIINGFAGSSSNLIPLLEDSPYFEEVAFVGPIKKTRDKEQFKLSAKIVRSTEGEKIK